MSEWTGSQGQSPSGEKESGSSGLVNLTEILEPMRPELQRYFLSPTELSARIRHAEERGKRVPMMVRNAASYLTEWWKSRQMESKT
jgi:hypothetical protein